MQQKGELIMVNTVKLKQRMLELNISQKNIAEKMRIKPPTVSQKINNIWPMSLEEAELIAKMLNIQSKEFQDYFLYQSVA